MKLEAYKDEQTGMVLLVNREQHEGQAFKEICFTKAVEGYEAITDAITRLEDEAGIIPVES